MRISDWSSDVCSSDLIVGLPFFAPLFDKRNRIRLWAGHLVPELTLHDVLVQFMNAPPFPVPPKIFAANVSFHDFTAGDVLEPKLGVRLITAPLNHPTGATGDRKSVVQGTSVAVRVESGGGRIIK